MKILRYNIVQSVTESGEPVLTEKIMTWSEANEEIVKGEAYNGQYWPDDDGTPEPIAEPTADEILNAMLGVNRYA